MKHFEQAKIEFLILDERDVIVTSDGIPKVEDEFDIRTTLNDA